MVSLVLLKQRNSASITVSICDVTGHVNSVAKSTTDYPSAGGIVGRLSAAEQSQIDFMNNINSGDVTAVVQTVPKTGRGAFAGGIIGE